jgi:hypothetical protein
MYRDAVRLIPGAFTLALLTVPVGAQTVRLGDVVARLDGYLQGYEERLANVVAGKAVGSGSRGSDDSIRRRHGCFARTLH